MDEKCREDYLNLINKLLSCPSGQEPELLEANWNLVDAELLQLMRQIAAVMVQQGLENDAQWLVSVAEYLDADVENVPNDRLSRQNQSEFLANIFQAIVDSESNPEIVYSLLKNNLDYLNVTLISVLQDWGEESLQELESEEVQGLGIGLLLYSFGNLVQQFPKGCPTINLSISIASYQLALKVYRQPGLEDNLSSTLTNLGIAYDTQAQLGVEPATNLQRAIENYREAAQIRRQLGQEKYLPKILNSLGITYSLKAEFGIEPITSLQRAIKTYQEAIQICRQLRLVQDLAQILTNLGNAYLNQAELGVSPIINLESTIKVYAEAVEIFRKPGLEPNLSLTLTNLGVAYLKQAELGIEPFTNLQQAIKVSIEATPILRQLGLEKDLAGSLDNLGVVYRTQAELGIEPLVNLQQAIKTHVESAQILRQLGLERDLSLALIHLGVAYYTQAKLGIEPDTNLKRAIDVYLEATQILQQPELERDLATALESLGIAYCAQGQLGIEPDTNLKRAIDVYLEAAHIFRRLGLKRGLSHTLDNLGSAYSDQAKRGIETTTNLQQAIDSYREAAQIRNELGLERELSQTLNNLGENYRIQAELGIEPTANLQRAIDTFSQAVQIFSKLKLQRELSQILNNLGIAYSIQVEHGIKLSNSLKKAIQTFSQAAQIRRQLKLKQDLSKTLTNMGNMYNIQAELGIDPVRNHQKAIASYREALQTFTPQMLPSDCFVTGLHLGNLGFTKRWWKLALEGYTPAIAAVEQTRFWSITESRKKEVTEDAIQVYRNIVQTYIQLQQYDKALEYVDRSKTRNLVELLATRDLTPKGDISPDTLQQLQTLRQKLLIAERHLNSDPEELSTLRQELDSYIQTHIQPIDPSFSLTQKVEPIEFAAMREMLPDKQAALVAWYVMGDRVLTFIFTSQTFQPDLIELATESHQTLIGLINQYLSRYTQDKTAWKDQLPSFLQQLATLLNLTALVQHIPSTCDQLILVPHVFLHLLPLHALPLSNGDLLMDRFPRGLSYAPSIQLLQLSQTWSRPSLKHFFSIKNPTEDLSFADLEVATIRNYFHPNDDVLERQQAKKTALTSERLAQTNVAHFSCHGYFNFETPSQSALLLAGSKTAPKSISAEQTYFWASRDGGAINLEKCLTLGDIFALDLRRCRLTTLSACETGLTDFNSLGDEYIGLPSGFLYAGSPSVVSSLWTVDDLSTAFLTIQFYKNLQDSEQSPSVVIALNQAQIWLRDITKTELQKWIEESKLPLSPTVKISLYRRLKKLPDNACPFEEPYYWAAFCAISR